VFNWTIREIFGRGQRQGAPIMTIAADAGRPSIPVTGRQIFWGVCSLAALATVGWASAHAPSPAAFFAELGQSWSAAVVSLDLTFLGFAAVTFSVIESRRLNMRLAWIWIPLSIVLPAGSMFPLFLLMRERALLRTRIGTQPSMR
jgi:hypothetical protein